MLRIEDDFGLDAIVEIYKPRIASDELAATAKRFAVQLKATSLEPENAEFAFDVKTSTIRYWMSSSEHVVLTVCHTATRVFYWKWIDDAFIDTLNRMRPGWSAQQTVRVSVSADHRLDRAALTANAERVALPRAQHWQVLEPGTYQRNHRALTNAISGLRRAAVSCKFESVENRLRDLESDLKASTYVLAITGPSRAGKSTLMNALLGRDISPVGKFPTTAVALQFVAGVDEGIEICFSDGRSTNGPVTVEFLSQYATQDLNPDNKAGVDVITVRIANETLERGVAYLDAPGLHDASLAIQAVTQRALEAASAVVYVLDVSSHKFGGFSMPAHVIEDLRRLAKDPARGIDFILRLVNFATDRWNEAEELRARMTSGQSSVGTIRLSVDGEAKEYSGDSRVLDWDRAIAFGPDSVKAALMALEKWLYDEIEEENFDPNVLTSILRKATSVAVLGVLLDVGLKAPGLFLGPLEPLVQSPDLYHLSRTRTQSQLAQTAMIAWWRSANRQEAHEWHNQKHRRYDMVRVIGYIFAQRDLKWPALEEARRGWMKELEANGVDPFLEILVAHFDPANWSPLETPDGKHGYQFNPPEAIARRSEETNRELEQRMRFIALPSRCRRILDEGIALSETELLELLSSASDATADAIPDYPMNTELPSNCRCGAAAVAILRFRDWLAKNDSWRSKCWEWIVEEACRIQTNDPLRREDRTGWSSVSFCADAIPELFATDPSNVRLRTTIATLACCSSPDVIRRLFLGLGPHRRELGADFSGLLHVAVRAARLELIAGYATARATGRLPLSRTRPRLNSSPDSSPARCSLR